MYVNGGSVGGVKAGREASRVLKSGCGRRLARVRPDRERKRRTWRDIAAIVVRSVARFEVFWGLRSCYIGPEVGGQAVMLCSSRVVAALTFRSLRRDFKAPCKLPRGVAGQAKSHTNGDI